MDLGYDSTGEWDGDQQSLALTLGQLSERGHWVLNGQWTKREEIWQRDRGFSACAYGESGTPRTRNCIGSNGAWASKRPCESARECWALFTCRSGARAAATGSCA